jgi:hypothetical protein
MASFAWWFCKSRTTRYVVTTCLTKLWAHAVSGISSESDAPNGSTFQLLVTVSMSVRIKHAQYKHAHTNANVTQTKEYFADGWTINIYLLCVRQIGHTAELLYKWCHVWPGLHSVCSNKEKQQTRCIKQRLPE